MKPCAVLYQIILSGAKQWKRPTSQLLSKSSRKDTPHATILGKRPQRQLNGREGHSPARKEAFAYRNDMVKEWKRPAAQSLSKSFRKDSPGTTVLGKRPRRQLDGREERSPLRKETFAYRNEMIKEWKRPTAQSLSKPFRKDSPGTTVLGKRPRKQPDGRGERSPARKEVFAYRNDKIEGNEKSTHGYRNGMVREKEKLAVGYRTEMRRMSSEFAAMRREELQMFPDETSKPVKQVSKPSKPSKLSHSPPSTSPSTPKPPKAKSPKTQSLHIPILLESPEIVCINKPPSLLSQPGLPGEGTILDLLSFQRPDLSLQTVNRYRITLS
jgi:hypothetical protein